MSPIVALSITKQTTFQGAANEFSNVYTFDSGPDISDDWSNVANDIANLEKAIMDFSVTFLRYTVWNLGGTAASRVIIDAGDLSGSGTAANTTLYRECAYLVKFPLSRSPILKRHRRLSKWLHCVGVPMLGTEQAKGAAELAATEKAFILDNYATPLKNYGGPFNNTFFCDSTGERPGDPIVHPYVEHRQFHHG